MAIQRKTEAKAEKKMVHRWTEIKEVNTSERRKNIKMGRERVKK